MLTYVRRCRIIKIQTNKFLRNGDKDMTKTEVQEMIKKCREEATKYYEDGNLKEGKKWEKELKYFEKLLKNYE